MKAICLMLFFRGTWKGEKVHLTEIYQGDNGRREKSFFSKVLMEIQHHFLQQFRILRKSSRDDWWVYPSVQCTQ